MIVCPVCEHAQAFGGECVVCGKRLSSAGAPPPPPAPILEGLEPTRLAPIGEPAGTPLLELEPTRVDEVPLVPDALVPGVEATAAAPVDVDAVPIPEIERTEAAGLPDDGPTAAPSMVACRYCRTPALPGERICGRCGMRLPVLAAAAPAPVDQGPAICTCGTPVRAPMCPLCGARNVVR